MRSSPEYEVHGTSAVGTALRQPFRLRRDRQGPQGDALARLSGPHRRIRRTRMATRPPLVTADAPAPRPPFPTRSGFLTKALNAGALSHAGVMTAGLWTAPGDLGGPGTAQARPAAVHLLTRSATAVRTAPG